MYSSQFFDPEYFSRYFITGQLPEDEEWWSVAAKAAFMKHIQLLRQDDEEVISVITSYLMEA
jgi:hypothetical protein